MSDTKLGKPKISDIIAAEITKNSGKIDKIDYGKVTFVIQQGKVVRVSIEDGWLVSEENVG
ncbi:MAG: DUF2292 domain-containing protein [Bacillota bacterium]